MKNEKQLKRFENYYRFLKWERIEYQLFKGLYFRAIAISISINEDHVAKIYSPIFELEAFLNTIEKYYHEPKLTCKKQNCQNKKQKLGLLSNDLKKIYCNYLEIVINHFCSHWCEQQLSVIDCERINLINLKQDLSFQLAINCLEQVEINFYYQKQLLTTWNWLQLAKDSHVWTSLAGLDLVYCQMELVLKAIETISWNTPIRGLDLAKLEQLVDLLKPKDDQTVVGYNKAPIKNYRGNVNWQHANISGRRRACKQRYLKSKKQPKSAIFNL